MAARLRSIRGEYLDWLLGKVLDDRYAPRGNYISLLRHLSELEFYWSIPMDENRANDGLYLRYQFACEMGEDPEHVDTMIPEPCSVLEMLYALAQRCEMDIMSNTEYGNRADQWFWAMIVNLGLSVYDDANYIEECVEDIVTRWLDRRIGKNGEGSPFVVENPNIDMRDAEIWYQMDWYLSEVK